MNYNIATKICTTCCIKKLLGMYSTDKQKRDSLRSSCKSCAKLSGAAYRSINSEKEKLRIAGWRKANPEKTNSSNAAYRAANLEKIRASSAASQKLYRKTNPKKALAKEAAYRAANPEKQRIASAKYRASKPDIVRQLSRIYSHTRRARKAAAGGKLSYGLADRLFKLQRGKCPCCAKLLGKNYHLDHIMPLSLGGPNTDDNIQLLRQHCNNQKYAKHPVDFMQSRGFLL